MKRLCMDCGADISSRGRAATRCIPCSKKHANMLREMYKKRARQLKPAPVRPVSKITCPLVSTCFFGNRYGYCDYFSITGKTRTSMHLDDLEHLNTPCKEYQPLKGGMPIVDGST